MVRREEPGVVGTMRKCVLVGMGCATLALAACSTSSDKFSTGNFWVQPGKYDIGVAKVDITPGYAIRLSGFGFRRIARPA